MKKIGTVCFLVDKGRVLLAKIEYQNGKLLWNGVGGAVTAGETSSKASGARNKRRGRVRYTRAISDSTH